jgi:hypothetical protein
MTNTSTTIQLPKREPLYQNSQTVDRQLQVETKVFNYDRCFWSANMPFEASFASQEDVYKFIGLDVIDDVFAGFNSSVFAYGQTGSGKSYRYVIITLCPVFIL